MRDMYIERRIKYQIPVPSSGGGVKMFQEVLKEHGKKIDIKDIKSEIERRFGA